MKTENILWVLLGTAVLAGCGGKGLDTKIEWGNTEKFAKSCVNSYAEMKDANPKEFEALKAAGEYVVDLAQPRDQMLFKASMENLCDPSGFSRLIASVAMKDNIRLDEITKTYRDLRVWQVKNSLDAAYKPLIPTTPAWDTEDMKKRAADEDKKNAQKNADAIRKGSELYLALTGKPYVPPATK